MGSIKRTYRRKITLTMIIQKINGYYRASLAGYLDKYANTRSEAITLMLAQVIYWNKIKSL